MGFKHSWTETDGKRFQPASVLNFNAHQGETRGVFPRGLCFHHSQLKPELMNTHHYRRVSWCGNKCWLYIWRRKPDVGGCQWEWYDITAVSIFCPTPGAAPPSGFLKSLKAPSAQTLGECQCQSRFWLFCCFALCHSAGDYILETKPKEISEAQRLNYEQVRPA